MIKHSEHSFPHSPPRHRVMSPAKYDLVIGVPFREDATKFRRAQLDALLERFRERVFHDDTVGQKVLVIVAEQSNDGSRFNRGQALNCAYSIARDRFNVDGEVVPFVCHDCDMAPQASARAAYSLTGDTSCSEQKVRVLQASGCRYSFDGCFGGVTIYFGGSYRGTNGYPNGFWGWGGEDNAAYERCARAGVDVERVEDVAFDDLEVGVETIEAKLEQLDTHDARIKMKEKTKLLARNKKMWRQDGLSSLVYRIVDEEELVQCASMTCVKFTCEFLSERIGYVQCVTCKQSLKESEFSKQTLRKFEWQRDKVGGADVEVSCRHCTSAMPKQTFEKENIQRNEREAATRLACADCGASFASRSALFRHLRGDSACGVGL